MSGHCCSHPPQDGGPRYRRILWIALAVNAAMFFVEAGASFLSGSTALAADAADFAGDAANYGLSLAAIAAGGLWQSRAALAKGFAMGAYGIGVLAYAAWRIVAGGAPEPATMGIVGAMALAANVGVAILLYAYRSGNANMRSVWLCTRNDAIGNVAVLVAAAGVFGTGSLWPDVAVALLMAGLGIRAAFEVVGHSLAEIRSANGHKLKIG
jgi:Co/Zn/Cd efflux system component